MTNIIKSTGVDPYETLYAYEQMRNPDAVLGARVFRKKDVEDVNKLVEISRGDRETVKSADDWNVLANLVVFFIQRWPGEWMEFRKAIPEIRSSRRDKGYSETKEIRYIMALPFRLERLIKTIFPYQQFDKKFSNEFARRFKAFQVGGY